MNEEKNIFNTDLYYCDYCQYLDVTEGEQTKAKEPHLCTLFNRVVKHNGEHPSLPKLAVCIGVSNSIKKLLAKAKQEAIEQLIKDAMKQTGYRKYRYVFIGNDKDWVTEAYNKAMAKFRKFLREYKG